MLSVITDKWNDAVGNARGRDALRKVDMWLRKVPQNLLDS